METKVFSDDVIQRIASGNEPAQTLISLDVLKKVLSPHQMRNVLGGSDGDITKECNAATSSGCDGNSCTKNDGTTGKCGYEKNNFGIWQCRCS